MNDKGGSPVKQLKKAVLNFVNRLPYIKKLYRENRQFKENSSYPPGHFYSPIVLVEDINKREKEIWADVEINGIPGIDLNTAQQLLLVNELAGFYGDLPFSPAKSGGMRYYYENDYYSYGDAIILYSMIRHFNPARIIEVGSGFSSAVMMDVNERFCENKIQLTFIEPYPDRLFTIMRDTDRQLSKLRQQMVQDVPLDVFRQLNAGDILFIDSSHVVKTGSDLHYIIFKVLPVLKAGVLIHFHDIFYPFEYLKHWVTAGFNWNENYFIRAFLMHNMEYKIRFFADYLHRFYSDKFADMPLTYKNHGGNLWLEKTK